MLNEWQEFLDYTDLSAIGLWQKDTDLAGAVHLRGAAGLQRYGPDSDHSGPGLSVP